MFFFSTFGLLIILMSRFSDFFYFDLGELNLALCLRFGVNKGYTGCLNTVEFNSKDASFDGILCGVE